MRKFNFLYMIVIFALLLVLQNLFILRAVHEMSGDARVVNYSGLVRGATQRLVKLELSHLQKDELIAQLEEYLYGLAGYENNYGIAYMTYKPFQASVSDLLLIWEELKNAIYDYRAGIATADTLLEVSERHFQKADETTHNAEYGSEGKLDSTELLVTAGMAAISIIVAIVIFSLYLFRRSERHQMELLHEKNQQLEDAILKANEANRAKSRFLSNMSHDIRTPLNGIIGMTTIAGNKLNDPERILDCLHKIELSSRHLHNLVNDVLDMSKIESGKLFLNPVEIHLPQFVENLVNIIQQQVKAKKQELKVAAVSVSHERILGDTLRLTQIFINLLSNAIKFTPEGGRIGFLIEEQTAAPEGCARFAFTCYDTGIGMSEEFKQHLFDTFSREQDSRIDKIEGSGLGLSIAKRIVDMMKGDIQVKSEKNRGSEFTITLDFPLAETTAALWDSETLKGFRILAVESDVAICESLEQDLNSLGVHATVKNSAAEGLELLKKEAFDAVILDWDGLDESSPLLYQKIRLATHTTLPILISSVYERIEIEPDQPIEGIHGFLSKPLFKSTLFTKLREMLFAEAYTGALHSSGADSRLDGVRILLAEDNELNTEIAVEILTTAGILLDCAVNGKEALELFLASPPFTYAMILMDMQMPVMKGCEASLAIRSLPREDAALIPIIAMTANAFEEDIREALEAGMNEHVAKPIHFDALKKVIQRYLP